MKLAGLSLRCILLASLISLSVFAEAQAAVTLDEAYQSAVARTEPIALQRSLAHQAEERVDQIFGRVFPAVNLAGQYTYQDPVPNNGGGGNAAFTRPDQYNLRLNVVQPIFRGLGEWAELRSRKALKSAAEAREKNARLLVYRSVADAYYSVLAEETDCKNLEGLIALTEKQVRELKQRVSIGRSRIGDRLAAQARAASLRSQLLAQRNILAAAREMLRSVTGLGGDVELAVTNGAPTEPPPLDPLMSELTNRPDFEAARRDVESADESISVARAAHYPTLDATANYFFKRTGVLENSKWDAGIQFTMPLFAGGEISAAVREGVERRKTAELTLAQLRRLAEQELRTAHAASLAAVAQEKELLEATKLSEQNYDQQLKDYRNGLVTNLDVLNALETLAETRRGHDRLLFDAQARRVRLNVAAGKMPAT